MQLAKIFTLEKDFSIRKVVLSMEQILYIIVYHRKENKPFFCVFPDLSFPVALRYVHFPPQFPVFQKKYPSSNFSKRFRLAGILDMEVMLLWYYYDAHGSSTMRI